MEEKQLAIHVEGLDKIYKLFDHNRDRLVDSLGLTRKKKYREHFALKGVNLDIYQGECVGIIGTNGSGKSTILKIITGVLNETNGTVQVNGRISALLELGAGFNMEYNGIENVYLNGTMIGFSEKEIDEKLQDILDFADIGEYVYQPVKTYSSGMFVRLAFAVAINIDPEILIVDEVLAVGDAEFQKKCLGKMEEVGKAGRTVLFVSHNMGMVIKLCSKGFFLNSGEINYLGCMKDAVDCYNGLLYDRYASVQKEVDYRRRFTFIKVFTCDRYGCSKNEYKCYESICISIKIFVQQDARRVELALGLLDDNKYRIFSIYESLEKYQVKNGVVSLLISFPEGFIAPGRFSWVMCTHTPGIEAYDNLEDVCHFSILDHDSVYARYPAGGFGAVVPQYMILSIDG